jgi:uncharacterized protein with GYD domain
MIPQSAFPEGKMAKYIMLCNWTDHGIQNVKDSGNRLDKARDLAKSLKGELKDFWMTMGQYDFVVTVDMPDDEAMATFTLRVASAGAVRSTTLKAFDEPRYRALTGAV